MRVCYLFPLLVVMIGCGASTQFVMPDKNIRLRQFKNVYVWSSKSTGAISSTNVGMVFGSAKTSVDANTVGSAISSGTATASGNVINSNEVTNFRSSTVYNGSASASGSTISSGDIRSGDRQAEISLEKFKFELTKMGFNVVNDPKQADAYVDFIIGTVSYDLLAGWIADEGVVKFINKNNDQTIAYFVADTKFVTPTVSSIIKNLAARIKRVY